jgi:outer membrane protein OmpA-like peptidoglycan-associated protein
MKILLVGFIALFAWAGLSSYIYVCKIKGLCIEPTTKQSFNIYDNLKPETGKNRDSSVEQSEYPGNLVIYFEFDKSELDNDIGTDKYIEESNTYLNRNSTAIVSITGYTDTVGSLAYNNALGYRRAKSMQHYFVRRGMPANKIYINSKGEIEPVNDNISDVGMATNRRTAITIKIKNHE